MEFRLEPLISDSVESAFNRKSHFLTFTMSVKIRSQQTQSYAYIWKIIVTIYMLYNMKHVWSLGDDLVDLSRGLLLWGDVWGMSTCVVLQQTPEEDKSILIGPILWALEVV